MSRPEAPRFPEATDHAFRLIDEIDRGAMGVVYRGVSRDGRTVAVKVLHPEFADDMRLRARFATDAAVLSSVKHPHVVRVHNLVVLSHPPDGLAIVMDLIEGTNLRRYLQQQQTVAPKLAADLVCQVLSALEAVHELGVVHRDVKPENILLELSDPERPHVRVTDFGIARVTADAGLTTNVTGAVLGTRDYIAPEFELPHAKVTPQVDLYAAGLVLYELVIGHIPYRGDADPLGPVPEALHEVLASLLSPFPEQRPASAREAREAVEDVLVHLEGLAPLAHGHVRVPQRPTVAKARRAEQLRQGSDSPRHQRNRHGAHRAPEADPAPASDDTALHARAKRAPRQSGQTNAVGRRRSRLATFAVVGVAFVVVAGVGGAVAARRDTSTEPLFPSTSSPVAPTTTEPTTTTTEAPPTTTTAAPPPTTVVAATVPRTTATTARRTATTARTTATTRRTTQTTSCPSHIPC